MSEKELKLQLKFLKGIAMNKDAKENSKRVLMTQISNTTSQDFQVKKFNSFSFLVKNVLVMSSRPAMVFAGVFLFLTASMILGSDLYKNSKPTDSLYVARIISERARLNITLDDTEREKLRVEFAKDQARDIANALMNPSFNKEENQDKVQKLTNTFKSEIAKVKNSIPQESLPAIEAVQETEGDSEIVLSVASDLKDDQGVEVYVNKDKFIEQSDSVLNTLKADYEIVKNDLLVSSETVVTTTDNLVTSTEGIKNLENRIEELSKQSEGETTNSILTKEKIEEIEKLFLEARYSEVLLMLDNIK